MFVFFFLCFTGKWKTVFEKSKKMENFMKFSGEVIEVQVLYSSKYNLQMSYNKKLQAEVSVAINAQRSLLGNGALCVHLRSFDLIPILLTRYLT